MRIYELWREGPRAADELIHEELEYVNPPDAIEGGTRRGRHMFDRVREVYGDVVLDAERVVPAGDGQVVVVTRLRGVARGSGLPIDTLQGYVWTVRDGRAVQFRWFRTPEEALRDAGVAG